MKRMSWRLIPIGVFLIVCLFLWRGLDLDPHQLPSVKVGKKIPQFNLTQLNNPKQKFSSQHLLHQVSLLNVWASWCEACVEEQDFLVELAYEGVPIYGINYKDNSEQALLWLEQWGNPYLLIGKDVDGTLAIDLGVYGAPETFVVDKKGIIRYRHVGIITPRDWKRVINPLMNKLEQEG